MLLAATVLFKTVEIVINILQTPQKAIIDHLEPEEILSAIFPMRTSLSRSF